MPFLSAEAAHIHYEVTGNGLAVMLIHGFPENGSLWQNIVPGLGLHQVIVPDLPGAVGSPLNGTTSIDDMAGMMYDLLLQEHIKKAVIVGHSLGGYVALSLARQFPQAVAGLCLVHSTPLPDDEDKKVARRKVIDLVARGAKEAILDQLVPGLFAENFKNKHSAIIEQQIQRSYLLPEASIINFYSAMMNRPSHTQMLESAPFPLQWILGTEDSLIPIEKILPYVHRADTNFISLYQDCGHMSMLEMPENVVADLVRFIEFCYR